MLEDSLCFVNLKTNTETETKENFRHSGSEQERRKAIDSKAFIQNMATHTAIKHRAVSTVKVFIRVQQKEDKTSDAVDAGRCFIALWVAMFWQKAF